MIAKNPPRRKCFPQLPLCLRGQRAERNWEASNRDFALAAHRARPLLPAIEPPPKL